MNIWQIFERFKKSKLIVPVYILLIVATSVLLIVLNACLAGILIPVAMFAIPYWLGERRLKVMALSALLVVLLNSFAIGALDTSNLLGYRVSTQNSGGEMPVISNGTVSPALGGENTVFNYTLTLTFAGAQVDETHVYLNISEQQQYDPKRTRSYPMNETDPSDYNLTDGKEYYLNVRLKRNIHYFHFAANVNGSWYDTLAHDAVAGDYSGIGPINMAFLDLYTLSLLSTGIWMLFTSILFFIILMMYWWLGKARIERVKWRERLEKEGLLEKEALPEQVFCPKCHKPVSEYAKRCPHCGAVIEEVEKFGEEE